MTTFLQSRATTRISQVREVTRIIAHNEILTLPTLGLTLVRAQGPRTVIQYRGGIGLIDTTHGGYTQNGATFTPPTLLIKYGTGQDAVGQLPSNSFWSLLQDGGGEWATGFPVPYSEGTNNGAGPLYFADRAGIVNTPLRLQMLNLNEEQVSVPFADGHARNTFLFVFDYRVLSLPS